MSTLIEFFKKNALGRISLEVFVVEKCACACVCMIVCKVVLICCNQLMSGLDMFTYSIHKSYITFNSLRFYCFFFIG